MTALSWSRAAAVKRSGDGVLGTMEDGRAARGSHRLLTVGMGPPPMISAWPGPGRPWTATGSSRSTGCRGPPRRACTRPGTARRRCWPRSRRCRAGSPCGTRWPRRCSRSGWTTWPRPSSPTRKSPPSGGPRPRSSPRAGRGRGQLPLATNARAKMQGFRDGFVNLFAAAAPASGSAGGGAPRASELILAAAGRGAVADRGPDGAHVRRLSLAVRQPDRGGPLADAPGW